MKGKVIEYGDGVAIVIEQPLPSQVNLPPGTQLDIAADGQTLIVTPAQDDVSDSEFEAALEKVNQRYGRALKRLAE